MSYQINNEFNTTNDKNKNNFISEINMTPFVDVCLVLLIIFMVTAPFAISGVNVQLPKSTQTKPLSISNDSLVLSISKQGDFYLGKVYVKNTDLVSKIKNSIKNQTIPAIFIRADADVPYNKVMLAMTAAQKAGIEKIGMVGETKRDKK